VCWESRDLHVRAPSADGHGQRSAWQRRRRRRRCQASSHAAPEPDPLFPPFPLSQVSRLVRNTASTFAPRASGATGKNPAFKGSTLYTIFGVQAWVSAAVGGLLAFNLLAPSDEPSIARLIGMWSVWMFTVPALRARECTPQEKEALNLLFLVRKGEMQREGRACSFPPPGAPSSQPHTLSLSLPSSQAIPLVNVTLPLVYKSFAAVYAADMVLLAAVFAWKLGGGGEEEEEEGGQAS